MQKITTFLWFDNQAAEAAKFYTSVFKSGKIKRITHYNEAVPDRVGQVMTVEFKLEGQDFIALNGGPNVKFTQAISLMVKCKTQKEVDRYWKKLTAGGSEVQCGWLTDKYGLSWQIVPSELLEVMFGKSRKKALAATQAMLQMKKIDLKAIKKAAKGENGAAKADKAAKAAKPAKPDKSESAKA